MTMPRESSHRHHGHGHDDHKEEPQYVLSWTWGCCNYSQSAGMAVLSATNCPNCNHLRCENCLLEQVKSTLARAGSSFYSYESLLGSPSTCNASRPRNRTSVDMGAFQSSVTNEDPDISYISDIFQGQSTTHDSSFQANMDEQGDEEDPEASTTSKKSASYFTPQIRGSLQG